MTLDKRNVEDILGLTSTQSGILFHYLYGESRHQYFEQTTLKLAGELDQQAFTRAWQHVVDSHEMLRTSFAWKKIKKPVQIIWHSLPFAPRYFDIADGWGSTPEAEIRNILQADKKEGFDLEEVPFRVKVIRIDAGYFAMVISAHSILCDGWSFNLLLKEFFHAYASAFRGEQIVVFGKPQFRTFVKSLSGQETPEERNYWRQYLQGVEFRVNPLREKNVTDGADEFGSSVLRLDDSLSRRIDELAKRSGFSVSSLFHTVWGLLLQRIMNERDVCFGITFSGRSAAVPRIGEMVGNFLNSSPLRFRAGPDDPVSKAIFDLAGDILLGQSYEQTSLFKIREYAGIPAQTELFDSLFIFENHPVDKEAIDGHKVIRLLDYSFEHASNYPLTVFVLRSADRYEIHIAYDAKRYKKDTLLQITGFFETILGQVVKDPSAPVRSISLLDTQESCRILYGFNETRVTYNSNLTLKELLETVAETFSGRVALQCGDLQFTYGELHARANRIAWELRARLGEGKCFVGVITERSIEMVVSVLAVIKAGYAYVPIDPSLPVQRMFAMLDNLSIRGLITTPAYETLGKEMSEKDGRIHTVLALGATDRIWKAEASALWSPVERPAGNLPTVDRPQDIAYVIFTSGSTGMPKGVMVQHRPVINILEWVNNTFEVTDADKVFCVASLGFDLSVYDIFGTLSKGAAMYIATFEDLVSPDILLGKLIDSGSTIWNSAPAVLQNLLRWNEMLSSPKTGERLRLVLLSGDWIGLALPGMARKYFSQARVVSLGGATEATIWSNYYFIDAVDPTWSSIPYGKPIQNCVYYILDQYLLPCPIGVTGDLYIGGECLALGYVNDEPLTAKKFVADAFHPGSLMYATGDLARWHDNGNMELIGRKDNQVKIRGYRIELGEIESQLLKIPGIDQALAVVDKKGIDDKFICAYYIGEREMDDGELKKILALALPAYMIPLYIARIDIFPVTGNGKVDRSRLPRPAMDNKTVQIIPPESRIQARILSIWSRILNMPEEHIGIRSDFFALGGHSLNVTELTSSLSNGFDIALRLRDVFAASTVEVQAALVAQSLLKEKNYLRHAEKREYYPLTPAQTSMYALQQANPSAIAYNISGAAAIAGDLDIDRMEAAFQRIIELQESFRTQFEMINGQLVQTITASVEFTIRRGDAGNRSVDDMILKFIQPFNLERAPLIRAAVFSGDKGHLLIVDMHHIIADGYSLRLFMRDLATLYGGGKATPPAFQYKDYAEWITRPFYRELLEKQKQFWRTTLSGKLPRLNLPIDFERSTIPEYYGEKVYFSIEGTDLAFLKEFVSENQSTLFTMVLCLFNVLLARVCDECDVLVGKPVLGRNHHQLDGITGMFVNAIIIRSQPSPEKTFREFFRETRKRTLDAGEHDDLPLEYLIPLIDGGLSKGRHPIFDVAIEYDNLGLHRLDLPGLQVTIIDDLVHKAKFDLLLEVIELDSRLDCRFEYRTSLFQTSTIEWLAERFLNILHLVRNNADMLIGDIQMGHKKREPRATNPINFHF